MNGEQRSLLFADTARATRDAPRGIPGAPYLIRGYSERLLYSWIVVKLARVVAT
jgi:hypothetical protein